MAQALFDNLRSEAIALPHVIWWGFAAILLVVLLADLVFGRFASKRCRALEAKYAAMEKRMSSLESHREREMLVKMRGPRDAAEPPRAVRSV